jgi:glycosyltransferase involved in cell wall biosynthesis
MTGRLLIVVNDPAFFLSHRLPVATAAREAGFDVHVATADGRGIDRILAAGLAHHRIPLSRSGTRPMGELKLILALYRLFRELQPDVVHLVTIKPVLYGGIVARMARVPAVVLAVSGLGFVFLDRGPRAALVRTFVSVLYRLAFGKRILRVIFQNPDDREALIRAAGLTRDKSLLIPGSGIDLSSYADTAFPASGSAPVVVMAARLLREKGVHEFVAAAHLLRDRGVIARFWLAGEPDPDSPGGVREADLSAWRAAGVVELLGPRDDIAHVFSQSDLVVLPSYREGLPKVLVEAAACGRAVVTSDVPGCRDAIVHNVTGLLVSPRDVVSLADAIERLLADQTLRQRMGRAGRAFAERTFSIESVVAAHLAVYRELRQAGK